MSTWAENPILCPHFKQNSRVVIIEININVHINKN